MYVFRTCIVLPTSMLYFVVLYCIFLCIWPAIHALSILYLPRTADANSSLYVPSLDYNLDAFVQDTHSNFICKSAFTIHIIRYCTNALFTMLRFIIVTKPRLTFLLLAIHKVCDFL